MFCLRIVGGDGDQKFFSDHALLRETTGAWFPTKLGQWYGDAILFITVGGICNGEYVALTPRTVGPLKDQLRSNSYGSVIVHKISNPTSSFDPEKDALAVGMAAVQVLP